MRVAPVESSSPRIGSFSSVLRGGSSMRFSSSKLRWTSIALERHVVPPREVSEGMTDHPLLVQWQGNSVARGEYLSSRGRFVLYARRPTTLTFFSPGALPPARCTTKIRCSVALTWSITRAGLRLRQTRPRACPKRSVKLKEIAMRVKSITGTRITEDRNRAFARPCVTNQPIP
jgi:hypothetical protein